MTVLNEAQREFFLGVAGVRLWYARAPLPGAAPSPDFDFPQPEPQPPPDAAPLPQAPGGRDAGTPAAARPRRPAAAPASIARIQGLLAGTGAARPEPAAPAPVRGSGAASAAAAEAESPPPEAAALRPAIAGGHLQAHWGFWASPEWLLMSSLSADASRALQDTLAGNILRAIGMDLENQRELRWPVFNNPAVAGNDAAGLADVVAGLAGELGGRRLLMLGVLADEPPEPLLAEVLAPLGQPALAFPASLAALAADPARKRDLWQALKPLLESRGRR